MRAYRFAVATAASTFVVLAFGAALLAKQLNLFFLLGPRGAVLAEPSTQLAPEASP